MKKLLKILLVLLLVAVLAFGGLAGYLSVTEYKPADIEEMTITRTGDGSRRAVDPYYLTIMSWNIGYAGLGAESDFFMDGGKNARSADKDTVNRYLEEINNTIRKDHKADLIMLQEVDFNSSRTYSTDESAVLRHGVSVQALNYSCPFVPVPFPPMGKVHSGLLTTTEYDISSAERISLPCPFSWPLRIANLKRCLLVSRLPVDGSEHELVLVNLHLEAYDDGEGKLAQTQQLMEFLQEEYEKGNYVIAGGDFNQVFPGGLTSWPNNHPDLWSLVELETDTLPEGFGYVYDLRTPSCRLLNQPYDPTDTENTQYYVIDGFIVSPNVTVESSETIDLDFRDSDHNPVLMTVTLET